ncbi:MAG: hypothetical protein JWQ04_998 [Pedosphaera sp.]|nr:hypothetical protein [Pedosphaera sp.]
MNLKQAKAKNKLAQFIKERQKEKQPPGNKRKLERTIKAFVFEKEETSFGNILSGCLRLL